MKIERARDRLGTTEIGNRRQHTSAESAMFDVVVRRIRRMLRMFQEAGPERPTFIDERPRFAGRHWLTSVARQPMMTPQTYVATKPLNGASCWPPEHRPKNKLIEIFTAHLPPPALLSSLSLLSSVYSYLEGQLVCPRTGCEILQQACVSVCLSVYLHVCRPTSQNCMSILREVFCTC